ncbi:DNA polymerase delta subunit 2 [Dinochytrium kinnereticum]|nr:DNA polymerase delta subunit 2 [Dinochytrium kinnereticum]
MVVERKTCSFANLNEPFLVKERSYVQQFAGIYFTRLNMLRPAVMEMCKKRWAMPGASGGPSPTFVKRILDVPRVGNSYFVGTVYKDMPLKPSILDELTQDSMGSQPQPPRQSFWSSEDEVLMEDESGRIKLTGPLVQSELFVTGVVLGVLGHESEDGCFEVLELCCPAPRQSLKLDLSSPALRDSDPYVALVSGLNLSSRNSTLEAQLAFDYLSGDLGDMITIVRWVQNDGASNVVRVIFAGNTLDCGTIDKLSTPSSVYNVLEGNDADLCLRSLTASVPISLMPGQSDPGTYALPQQPLHSSLFPKSCTLDSFDLTTNPTLLELDSVRILGCSGQNVDDILKYQDQISRIDIAEHLLKWNHIAPTAPDTLWCYPFQDDDPFVVKEWPHIFFVGNQPEFATKLITGKAVNHSVTANKRRALK